MWNPFKKKPESFIVLSKRSFSRSMADEVENKTGKKVILAEDVSDVKLITEELNHGGDGKAEFFGQGTEEEYNDQVKEDKGLTGLFGGK